MMEQYINYLTRIMQLGMPEVKNIITVQLVSRSLMPMIQNIRHGMLRMALVKGLSCLVLWHKTKNLMTSLGFTQNR